MKVAIKKEEYLTSNETQPPPVGEEPIKFFFPNLNLYTFYYSMGIVGGDDNLPSNMFYVDGYPIFYMMIKNLLWIKKIYHNIYIDIKKYGLMMIIGWLPFVEKVRNT